MSGRRVGVVGLGLVGTAVARRLLGAGMAVHGIDLAPDKVQALEAMGGTGAAEIRDLLGADAIVLAVFDTAQVEAAVAALLPAAGQIVISISTVDPERIAALAASAAETGIRLVEMPISGSSAQLAAGDALGLVAGDTDEVDDILAAICPSRARLARVGDGARAKLAINLILGLNRAALAEGLVFAERLGLGPADFLDIARTSAAYAQVMDTKGVKMVARDYTPQGRIAQSAKDFALIAAEAARLGQPLPMAALYSDLIAGCIGAGEADWDNAAIIEELRRRARRGQGAA